MSQSEKWQIDLSHKSTDTKVEAQQNILKVKSIIERLEEGISIVTESNLININPNEKDGYFDQLLEI